LQELLQSDGTYLVESRPQAHLHGFQIGLPRPAPLGEDPG
jgi:hypothetical protein